MRSVFGVERPRVGLLANGEEETKGDQLTQEAHQLHQGDGDAAGLNFIGNVEGRDINAGTVDVVVCDGFVGNVVLKLSEGLSKMILGTIRKELTAGPISTVGALLAKPAFDRVRKTDRLRRVRRRAGARRQRRLDHLPRPLAGQGDQERDPRRGAGGGRPYAGDDRAGSAEHWPDGKPGAWRSDAASATEADGETPEARHNRAAHARQEPSWKT